MASDAPTEIDTRCQRWLEEIDVQHHGEQELAELMSIRTTSQIIESGRQSLAMSLDTAATACNVFDWKQKFNTLPTPLCMGLVLTIPQWSFVQDADQNKFALYHLACRRGNVAWEVRKRYSDFVMLHNQLQHQYRLALFVKMRLRSRPHARDLPFMNGEEGRFSTEPLPTLPPRRFWPATNTDVDAVIKRSAALQAYLQGLLQLPRPTQPFSPLNRFLSESNSSYVRVLSISNIISPGSMDGEHPRAAAPLPSLPLRQPETATDLIRRITREPSKAMIRIEYPEWVQHEEFWKHEYHTDFDKMQLVIDISRKNVSFNSGGPFGAAIFNKTTNKLVSVGMSLVEHSNNCCLHAEMVAVQMATTQLRSHTLDRDPAMAWGEHELFSSSEPCAMCIGATLWCGVQKLVCAATDVDVRSLLHDTGPVFEESFRCPWVLGLVLVPCGHLQSKGIQIKRKFLRSEAKQVLCEYSAVRTSVMGRQV